MSFDKKYWEEFDQRSAEMFQDGLGGEAVSSAFGAAQDMVNSPPHYNCGEIETIDYIVDVLGTRGAADYCQGNVLKYLGSRLHRKNDPVENSKKAQWYLAKMIELLDDKS